MISNSIDEELIESFFKISRFLRDLSVTKSTTAQLTMLQLETLVLLKKNGKSTMGEIAKCFQIKMPTATSLLNKLIKAKLVKRSANSKDRRIVEITLTANGNLALKNFITARKAKIRRFLSYLSPSDKKELLKIIQKITKETNS